MSNKNNNHIVENKLLWGSLAAGCSLLAFVSTRYRISYSNEWLVRTGFMVQNVQIGKKFVQWPFQNVNILRMNPTSYHFSINAMSQEKMEFVFPMAMTIGPKNEQQSLTKYATFLMSEDETNDIVRGIVEGESRSLAARLSIEQIFSARTEFKDSIIKDIQSQLDQFGLHVYNANIEELKDSSKSNYFNSLSLRIKSEAENKAKIDVAEQNKKGDIGKKEREAETRQRLAIFESDTQIVENQRQQAILVSQAEMEKTKAEQQLVVQQANIRMEQESESLRLHLAKEVEIKRQEMEMEKIRANELTKTKVQAEMLEKEALGKFQYEKIIADAQLYKSIKEAEGIAANYQAQSDGLQKLIQSFNGDSRALLSYTMLEKGIYEKLAESNAKAIQNLNPKITVWSGNAKEAMEPIQQLGKTIVPLVDIIHDQTGYKLPEWIIQKELKN